MSKSIFGSNSFSGIALKHRLTKFKSFFIEVWNQFTERFSCMNCKVTLKFSQFFYLVKWEVFESVPVFTIGGTSEFEDFHQLVFIASSCEKWFSVYEFSEDATNRPYIN